jgi:geranylgeranylglycerol-phosphate geranylgeranyltransferase
MGYLEIIWPLNCAITFISVLVGAWVGRGMVLSVPLILAGGAGFAACAFGNIVNDLLDVEIDRINDPRRPLPSGRARREWAIAIAAFFGLAGILTALPLGRNPLLLVFCALALLFLYAIYFKRTPAANPIVALVASLSFLLGGWTAGNNLCLVPFGFALLIHLPREIVKDVIDLEGDRPAGVRSLPIRFGTRKALVLSAILLGLLAVLLPLPYLLKILRFHYLVVVILGALPLFVFIIIKLLGKPDRPALIRLSALLKVVMGIGLVGFIVG